MENLSDIRIQPARLRDARRALQIAQCRAAAMVGIHKQRLYAYEAGKDQPPADVIARLCLLYRQPIDFFVQP